MTDTTKPEDLNDDALDSAQGGAKTGQGGRARGTKTPLKPAGGTGTARTRDEAAQYVGETEKGIVASSGDGSI